MNVELPAPIFHICSTPWNLLGLRPGVAVGLRGKGGGGRWSRHGQRLATPPVLGVQVLGLGNERSARDWRGSRHPIDRSPPGSDRSPTRWSTMVAALLVAGYTSLRGR